MDVTASALFTTISRHHGNKRVTSAGQSIIRAESMRSVWSGLKHHPVLAMTNARDRRAPDGEPLIRSLTLVILDTAGTAAIIRAETQ